MSARRGSAKLELLVVDGYNVIFSTPRYQALIDEGPVTNPRLGNDVHARSREALIADVAAFAAGTYRPVIVFDGGGNRNPERPELTSGGVRLVFSKPGEEDDEVIERLAVEARLRDEAVTVISSDTTIQATIGGVPITKLSSDILVREAVDLDHERAEIEFANTRQRMTVKDRLDPETLAKLNELLGR